MIILRNRRERCPVKVVPLTNDILFKSVFGRDTNTCILRAFLNSVLGFSGEDRIEKVAILNPFRYGEKLEDRLGILDIAAKDSWGRRYHIEMQVGDEKMFIPRVSFYHARLHGGQLGRGDDFTLLKKTIAISIVSYVLFPGFERVHSRFSSPHFLKFSVKYATIEVEVPAVLKDEEGMEMAVNEYRKSLADRRVQNMIHFREKAELIEATKLTLAREEGKAEGKAEVAARLRSQGFERETIKKATALSDAELDRLGIE
ncbi:MAG: Rpn family recombination-promoting nuclease/putative transposase [Candidatus Eremiobacteraeota bacterium]|nr:Rpn family recombination-promoting nuclease/putative transposase [Candidatus Eremiobacteraeota bacterium]